MKGMANSVWIIQFRDYAGVWRPYLFGWWNTESELRKTYPQLLSEPDYRVCEYVPNIEQQEAK
jgi:hypothetical protein